MFVFFRIPKSGLGCTEGAKRLAMELYQAPMANKDGWVDIAVV